MGNQQQTEIAKQLIKTSTHLSGAEREEWSSLLPFMNDKQVNELIGVLESSPAVSAPPALPPAPVEKDLPAPRPVTSAVTKPALGSSPSATQPLVPKSHGTLVTGEGANTVSAFLNRNFATALHRKPVDTHGSSLTDTDNRAGGSGLLRQSQEISSPPSSAGGGLLRTGRNDTKNPVIARREALERRGDPNVVSNNGATSPVSLGDSVGQGKKSNPLPVQSVENIDEPTLPAEVVAPPLKSLEDARRLNVATLRGRGTLAIEQELKVLCTKFGYFSVQFALEHAPLYQTYLAVGSRVLKNHEPFETVQADLSRAGRPNLTKPEFEEVNDLLQRIKTA